MPQPLVRPPAAFSILPIISSLTLLFILTFCSWLQVIGREQAKGQIYNIQDTQSVTFEGLARLSATAMGMDGKDVQIKLYEPKNFDFGEKKAFPMRAQHFFCGVDKAIHDLDWTPKYNMLAGLKDSYETDFKVKQAAGKLKSDFFTDDMIINGQTIAAAAKV